MASLVAGTLGPDPGGLGPAADGAAPLKAGQPPRSGGADLDAPVEQSLAHADERGLPDRRAPV
jgi:hypothetical protein